MSWVSANALSACIAPMRFQQLAGINILGFRILRIFTPILFKFYFAVHVPSNSLCQPGA